MAIQTKSLTRQFRYNSVTLPDPGPDRTPEQVKQAYASQYPELTTSVIEGPVTKGGVMTYTFARAAGSKGATQRESLQRLINGTLVRKRGSLVQRASLVQIEEAKQCSKTVVAIAANRTLSAPLVPPTTAYGVFG